MTNFALSETINWRRKKEGQQPKGRRIIIIASCLQPQTEL